MTSHQLQSAILEHLRRQVPPERNIADELAAILQLNKNAAYKRINGATPFTLDDLARLAAHYRLSWQQIFHPEEPTFLATFSGFTARTSPVEYLKLMEQDMMALQQAARPKVWYLTVGLPDFYYFYFEGLALFQAFIWERMVWDNPAWQGRKFSLHPPGKQDFFALSRRLSNNFSYIPTIEIWNEHVLDNLFHQIQYVAESQLFERKEDVLELFVQLEALVGHLEQMAFAEKQFPPGGAPPEKAGPWSLFFSEIMQNNIMVLVQTEHGETIYSVFDNPNYFKSDDPQLLGYAKSVLERHLKRATPLGMAGEKSRNRYFGRLQTMVADHEEKVKRMLT